MLDQATRILAIRHGETAWNVDTRIQGHLDIPLNETGRRQASCVARALADETLDAVYASDLARALETAQALGAAQGLPVVDDSTLRERCFGIFEGRTWKEVEEIWPEAAQRWRRREPDFGPEGGETLQRFYERCIAAVGRIALAHPGQSIALVVHGGVLDCLYRAGSHVELQAPRTWSLANAGINRLLHTPDGFTLVGWGDTLHLEGAALDGGPS
jgi:2,3-bisphosphoglycerate-dependent phosphoglycerate mutase